MTTMGRSLACAAIAAMLAGCGAAPVSPVRFHNAPPVWQVNDRKPVAKKPADRPFSHLLYFFDAFFFNQLTEAMELEHPRRALNVNSFDEVPDSTWFTNRIGVRDITAAEMARGPYSGKGPTLPIKIKGTKVGGKSVGFIIKDANGDKYITKFDELGYPLIETAANVIVLRFMWALGYNVPDDTIISLSRDDLQIADDAKVKDVFGNGRKMTTRDLEDNLAKVNIGKDGRYRVNASKFLPGIPIGGFAQRGVRQDDPNDVVPHEHRREVRALYVFYSWLQATDVKEDNSLDIYASDPEDERIKYVVHYIIDFGKSLGANATIPRYAPDGHAARVDVATTLSQLVSFGLVKRPWEGTYEPNIDGVGRMDVEHFEPGGYNPQQPYRPFEFVDRLDGYWAAKLIMRFSPDMIRAAVEQGRFDDPRAVDYLTEVLIGRQQKLARYWFRQVSPLERFAVEEVEGRNRLCFSDLMIEYDLDPLRTANTRWTAGAYDYAGNALDWSQSAVYAADPQSTACLAGFPLGRTESDYTIVRISTRRHGRRLPAVDVHLARDPQSKALGVIGIHRN